MKNVTVSLAEYDRLRRLDLAQDGALKAAEAAVFLGISERSVYDLRAAGVLTYAEVRGKYVFPKKGLIEYLAAHTKTGSVAA